MTKRAGFTLDREVGQLEPPAVDPLVIGEREPVGLPEQVAAGVALRDVAGRVLAHALDQAHLLFATHGRAGRGRLGGPRREGGRLVAPGSSDMKGGLAVMMELAERLPRAARSCDLALVMYAREEGPFLENELGDVLREVDELREADLALCLEPTDNLLQLGCVGSIHATFTFEGRSAHSARPWQGENAVHAAGPLLAELHARAPRQAVSGGLVFREVTSITRIEGGRARNVVPDRCALNVNFRFAPDKTLEAAAEELTALAARHGAAGDAASADEPVGLAVADHVACPGAGLSRVGLVQDREQLGVQLLILAQARDALAVADERHLRDLLDGRARRRLDGVRVLARGHR